MDYAPLSFIIFGETRGNYDEEASVVYVFGSLYLL